MFELFNLIMVLMGEITFLHESWQVLGSNHLLQSLSQRWLLPPKTQRVLPALGMVSHIVLVLKQQRVNWDNEHDNLIYSAANFTWNLKRPFLNLRFSLKWNKIRLQSYLTFFSLLLPHLHPAWLVLIKELPKLRVLHPQSLLFLFEQWWIYVCNIADELP